jgi:hypothetical protein
MTRRTKRFLVVLLVVTALVIACPFAVHGIVSYLVYRHRFASEMRVVAPDGSITFRPYELHLEDKGHMVQVAFLSKALWPVHHISTADYDYLFGPFGRVVVLTTVGFHARAVTDSRHWSGDRHSFPFSDTPLTEQDFLQNYVQDSTHNAPDE